MPSNERHHYAHPPIVEAVIDTRFDAPLSEKDRERLRDRLKNKFPAIDEKKEIRVEVGPKGVSTNSIPAGFKMTAKNAVDLVLINPESFGTARLAPYDRWEQLISIAKENFDALNKAVGRRKVVRLGVRFINRIDIPQERMTGHSIYDFINLGIALPKDLARENGPFSFSINFVEMSTGARVILQGGQIIGALLDHLSFNLDIDAFWDSDIPGRIDEMWQIAELLRKAKNACFEHCITDSVRSLFQ